MRLSKQSVELKYVSPLALIADGIRYSRANHQKSDSWAILERVSVDQQLLCSRCGNPLKNDSFNYCNGQKCCEKCDICYTIEDHIGPKDLDLIKRIGFHARHESVLEHSLIVYEVKMSTKALLEESRHRIGVSQVVTSSRYALDVIDIEFMETKNDFVNQMLKNHKKQIMALLNTMKDENGKIKKSDMDDLAMLLPQAFIYTMQLSFNLRSLMHFLRLRTEPGAHYSIREIAIMLIDELSDLWKELVFQDKKVKENYEKFKKENNG